MSREEPKLDSDGPPEFVAAIDTGTTSTRCILFDKYGTPTLMHQVEYPQHYPYPGWHEQDPLDLLESVYIVMDCIADKMEAAGIPFDAVKAFGITNQRETTLVWDRKTGQPLYNAIVWDDSRTNTMIKELSGEEGPDILKDKTGMPLTTYFSGLKLKWLVENVDDVKIAMEEDRLCFGTIDSWYLYNLTGGPGKGLHYIDISNASRTLLFNLRTCDWDNSLLDFFGLKSSILPEIRSSSEVYGKIDHGPFVDTPISGMLGDQQAALVGQKCLRAGEAKNTYGTGAFLLFNTGEEVKYSKNGLISTVAYKAGPDCPTHFALEGSVSVAGAAITWLRDNMALIDSASEIGELAAQVHDTGGVYFVTAFGGLFAPYWDSTATGTLIGMTGYTTKAHVARATLEAACFQTRAILEAMNADSGVNIHILRVDGGMTNSDLAMQIQSDILGVEVERPTMRESTALGSAIMAGSALNLWGWDVTKPETLEKVNTAGNVFFAPHDDTKLRTRVYRLWNRAVERASKWNTIDFVQEEVEAELEEKLKIEKGIQSYDWGKIGRQSKAATFAEFSIPGFKIEDKPYAELWIGTHDQAPAYLSSDPSTKLAEFLSRNPDQVGQKVKDAFKETTSDGGLPFLFKVLAIEKALSVQAHPNKKLAEQLHKARPDVYKDSNHKPEMAIALTEFNGFCGFRPKDQIVNFLENVKELRAFVENKHVNDLKQATTDEQTRGALKNVFRNIMSASENKIADLTKAIVDRYSNQSGEDVSDENVYRVRQLVLTLNEQFPGDIGIFCAFLLNVVHLKPGESVFLKADDPHAYISGDIMECMATSNNVVRAGLTPKLRDVDTLVNMLTYESATADAQLMDTKSLDGAAGTVVYDPPIDEFSVARVTLSNEVDSPHEAALNVKKIYQIENVWYITKQILHIVFTTSHEFKPPKYTICALTLTKSNNWQTFGAPSRTPVSPRVQRPASEIAQSAGGNTGWNQQQNQLLGSAQLPPGSAGLGMNTPDTLDQWFENLGSYEDTLEEMAAASLDQNFKEELVAIEQWFRVLSEAERTAALYSLLQHSSQMQIRFFITVLQQMSRSDPISQALFSPSAGANLDGQIDTELSRMSLKSPHLAAVSGISAKNSPNLAATTAINRQSLAAGEYHLSPEDALSAHRQRFNSKRTSAPGHLPGPGTIGAGSSTDNLRSPNWQRGSGLEQVQERRSPTPSANSERPKSSDSSSFVRSDSIQDLNDDQALAMAQANANISSPLQQSANWSSMVNTPSIGNFSINQNQNQNQFDTDLQNWYANVTNSGNNNNAVRLDDARKFRRQSRQSVNYDDVTSAQDDYNGVLNNGLLTPGGTSVGNNQNNQNLQQLLAQQQQLINSLSSPGQVSAPTSPNPGNPILALQLQSLHQQQQLLQQQQLALGRLQQQQNVRAGPGLGIYGGNNSTNGSRLPSPYKQSFNQQQLGIPPNQQGGNKRSISNQSRQRNNTTNNEDELDERVLNDVATWLRVLRLHKYTTNFQDSNWKEMVAMSGNDLEARGVAAVGARRKMLKEFEKVREKYDIPATPEQEAEMKEEKEKAANPTASGNE
ncbi:hypothetical protein E3Q15_03012 [Wallemia mellicola]|nr:hypothetical protein E3Q15_03012 [Wallemia mellicola]